MPRDLTAEVVFDASRFARALPVRGTPYGVYAHSILCHSLCSEFCCWEYALQRFGRSLLGCVCTLSFAVVFSVVGCL